MPSPPKLLGEPDRRLFDIAETSVGLRQFGEVRGHNAGWGERSTGCGNVRLETKLKAVGTVKLAWFLQGAMLLNQARI